MSRLTLISWTSAAVFLNLGSDELATFFSKYCMLPPYEVTLSPAKLFRVKIKGFRYKRPLYVWSFVWNSFGKQFKTTVVWGPFIKYRFLCIEKCKTGCTKKLNLPSRETPIVDCGSGVVNVIQRDISAIQLRAQIRFHRSGISDGTHRSGRGAVVDLQLVHDLRYIELNVDVLASQVTAHTLLGYARTEAKRATMSGRESLVRHTVWWRRWS